MEITYVDGILNDVIAEIIRFAEVEAAFHSATRNPTGETARVLVATVVVALAVALAAHRAAEFAREHHESILEQPAGLEIFEERRGWLVDVVTLPSHVVGEIPMVIPAAVKKLNETDIALCHPASE